MISELIETYCPRSLQKRTVKDKKNLKGLVNALKQSIETLSSIEKQVVTSQLLQLRLNQLTQNQHHLTNYIFAKEHKSLQEILPILLSIPGIDPDTVFILIAELVDIEHFASPQQLVKWADLAPRVYQSTLSETGLFLNSEDDSPGSEMK